MFFRTKQSPSGRCLQLIEAYRNPMAQSRQRVVVSLGNANIPQAERGLIAQTVQGRLYHQGDLFVREVISGAPGWPARGSAESHLPGVRNIVARFTRDEGGCGFRRTKADSRQEVKAYVRMKITAEIKP